MSEESDQWLVDRLRAANARLRQVVASQDAEIKALRVDVPELRAMVRAQGLRIAELERRLGSGSDDSGTPSSKESIGSKARRKAGRRGRRDTGTSLRERSRERGRGGQPGHAGHGLVRDPDPQQRVRLDPPTTCRGCGAGLADARDAGTAWSQTWDVKVVRWRTEYLLPRRGCRCGTTTVAAPPCGSVNGIGYGPVINSAAVALTAFGNVATERAATLVDMLYGQKVSPGFVDRANARLAERLAAAGFTDVMRTALLGEPVLTADESPVEVVNPATDPTTGRPVPGTPHVMVIRTPDERLVLLTALDSRGHDEVLASLRTFTGYLIVDGYGAYPKLLPDTRAGDSATGTGVLAGIQQCCQHVMRRCKQVAKLGPGGLQTWATRIITVSTDAHTQVEAAKTRGESALDPVVLAALRARYDTAVASGIIHNRHRDWDGGGNHPGYALGTWLRTHADQVWLFTRVFAVDWTSNAAERGVKPAKRHQATSGYWQTDQTLHRWCTIQSYLTSARNHGLTIQNAITRAFTGNPWLPTITAA